MAESTAEIAEAKQAVEQAPGKELALALDMVHVALYTAQGMDMAQQLVEDQLLVAQSVQALALVEV